MLQSFPVLSGSLGQRLMGKRCVMDSLTFCSALCSRCKHVVSCMSLTRNWTEKVECGCPPKQDLYNPAFSCVLSKCAAWPSRILFGTMSLCLLPDHFVLRSAPRSWVAFHAHLHTVIPYRFSLWYIELDLLLHLGPCFCICSVTAFLIL